MSAFHDRPGAKPHRRVLFGGGDSLSRKDIYRRTIRRVSLDHLGPSPMARVFSRWAQNPRGLQIPNVHDGCRQVGETGR